MAQLLKKLFLTDKPANTNLQKPSPAFRRGFFVLPSLTQNSYD